MRVKMLDIFYQSGQANETLTVEFRAYRFKGFESRFLMSASERRITFSREKALEIIARLLFHPAWARINESRNIDGSGVASFSFWLLEEYGSDTIAARTQSADNDRIVGVIV